MYFDKILLKILFCYKTTSKDALKDLELASKLLRLQNR